MNCLKLHGLCAVKNIIKNNLASLDLTGLLNVFYFEFAHMD